MTSGNRAVVSLTLLLVGTIATLGVLAGILEWDSNVVEHWKQFHLSIGNAILLMQYSSTSRKLVRIEDLLNETDTVVISGESSSAALSDIAPSSHERSPSPRREEMLAPTPIPSKYRCRYTDNAAYEPRSPQCNNGMPTIPDYLLSRDLLKYAEEKIAAEKSSSKGKGEAADNGHGSSTARLDEVQEQQTGTIPRKSIPEFHRYVSTSTLDRERKGVQPKRDNDRKRPTSMRQGTYRKQPTLRKELTARREPPQGLKTDNEEQCPEGTRPVYARPRTKPRIIQPVRDAKIRNKAMGAETARKRRRELEELKPYRLDSDADEDEDSIELNDFLLAESMREGLMTKRPRVDETFVPEYENQESWYSYDDEGAGESVPDPE